MSSSVDCWGPLVTVTSAALGASGRATLNFDLEAENYDAAAIAMRVVFSATVAGNTPLDVYRGLGNGSVIDLVSTGQLVATAVTAGTAMVTTLINEYPYCRMVVANADSAATVDVAVYAQGHYEADFERAL